MDPQLQAEPVEVRYYPHDGSVFLDTHYLIKGVAGAIFWKLAREHSHPRRQEFSTRELRLAGRELRLPEVQDNLSVRLLLLQRRLAERGAAMQIHKTGRGRFRVLLLRPMRLVQAPAQGTTQAAPRGHDDRKTPGLATASASPTALHELDRVPEKRQIPGVLGRVGAVDLYPFP